MKIKSFLAFFSLLFLLGCSSSLEKKELVPLPDERLRAAISVDDVAYLQKSMGRYDSMPEAIYYALEANSIKSLSHLLDLEEGREQVLFAESPYFYARSREALDLLLEHGYSVNVFNLQEESLASYYLQHRSRDFFLYFLEKAKHLDLSKEKELPFLLVDMADEKLIQAALFAKANFLTLDSMGNYPIYYAKNTKIIEELLDLPYHPNQKNKRKELVLGEVYLHCLRAGKENLAQKCITLGVNPHYKSYKIKK